jgi:methionyl-tRNA synthetase
VYWPALLWSAGLSLPSELRVHGYLTVEGKKIGKSLGNAIDPRQLCEELGADALRYYLLRHISPFKDGDFSRERLITAHDSELADELGNLALRVLTLTARHLGGRAPDGAAFTAFTAHEQALDGVASGVASRLATAFAGHELSDGLTSVWELVRASNRYLDSTEPWRLARRLDEPEARTRLECVLGAAIAALRVIAAGLTPFVPELAGRLARAVVARVEPGVLLDTSLSSQAPRGEALGPALALVPRIRPRAA